MGVMRVRSGLSAARISSFWRALRRASASSHRSSVRRCRSPRLSDYWELERFYWVREGVKGRSGFAGRPARPDLQLSVLIVAVNLGLMGSFLHRVGFLVLAIYCLGGCAKVGSAAPAAVDAARMEDADRIIEAAIARKGIPGAVLLVERGGKTVYLKAYGNRSVQPAVAAMTTDTIFDMASLSKPMGCAAAILRVAERGRGKL